MDTSYLRFVVNWVAILCVAFCLGCEQSKTKEQVTEDKENKAFYAPPQMIHLGDITDALITDPDTPNSQSVWGIAIEADEFRITLSISLEENGMQQSIYRSSIPVKKPDGAVPNDRFRGMLALGIPKVLQKESDDFIELEFVTNSLTLDRKKPIHFKIPIKPILDSLKDISSDEWREFHSPSSGLTLSGLDRKIELPNRCFLSRVFAPGKETGFPESLEQTLNIQVEVDFPENSPTLTEQVRAMRDGKRLTRRMFVQPYESDDEPSRPAEDSLGNSFPFKAIDGSDGRVGIGGLSMAVAAAPGSVNIETTGVSENETTLQFTMRVGSENSIAWADKIRVPTEGFVFYPLSRDNYQKMFGRDSEKKYLGILLIPTDKPAKDNE